MTLANSNPANEKLSPQFRARLSHLSPSDKVRVILLLKAPFSEQPAERRPSRATRRKVIQRVRKGAAPAFREIDAALKLYGGERLASASDALGSIPVEVTVRGISALAASEHVKAILEDQAISALR